MKSPCKTVSFGGNGHIQTNEVILIYNYSPQIFLTAYPSCKAFLGMRSNIPIFTYKVYATFGKSQLFAGNCEGFHKLDLSWPLKTPKYLSLKCEVLL